MDVSTTQGVRRIKDQKKVLEDWLQEGSTIPDDMTLQNCTSGVTSPMENHGSMIPPLLSINYISQYPPIAYTSQ